MGLAWELINRYRGQMEKKRFESFSGYGLVEVLAALLILSITLLAFTKVIIFSFHTYRNSRLKFKLQQTLCFYQNQLVARSFDHTSLTQGRHEADENDVAVTWQVTDRSPDLKVIHLKVVFKTQTRKCRFYKSRYIKGVDNE
jgi:Tfp pilus assembly protein PilV